MSSYDLTNADTRLVFNNDYGTIAFYSISAGEITKGEKLLDSSPKFVKLKIAGSSLHVVNGLSAPATGTYSSYTVYGPDDGLADIWNSLDELIVGTGDLRPSGADIDPDKFSLTSGVIITSPDVNKIGIYLLG